MKTAPPFEITPAILTLVAKIERLLGQVDASNAGRPEPRLRKQNRIRTIKDSLAIEGNTLSLEKVTALFEKKRVIGPRREILEVQNAIQAYEMASKWKPEREQDFKKAHAVLMQGLLPCPGAYRSVSVGIMKGSKVSHTAPQAARLPELMGQLFRFVGDQRTKLSPLILSAVAHYEIEFIHPFEDGNGRMGRLWAHLILNNYHPAFDLVPLESLIKESQQEYYRALEASDRAGSSTEFVEFSLKLLAEGVEQLLEASPKRRFTAEERLERAREEFGSRWFTRKDYLKLFPGISGPTASRDLAGALAEKLTESSGYLNKTKYKFSLG
jgi:Fic family protein